MSKIFITGVRGQLGSTLSDLYLENGHEVFGLVRHISNPNNVNLNKSIGHKNFNMVYGDITDISTISSVFKTVQPDIIINTAAQSHVKVSWDEPIITHNINGVGVLNLLQAYKTECSSANFITLSSSDQFGNSACPQNENTVFKPNNPYSVSKLFAHNMVSIYRLAYDLRACCAICFNFESSRRSNQFVTQKIAEGVVKIKLGIMHKLQLGRLDVKRDWIHCKDTARGIMLLSQSKIIDDIIFGSGENHTVQEFCDTAFKRVGLNWSQYVVSVDADKRPLETTELKADISKAKQLLNWQPKISFVDLVNEMVDCAMEKFK